MLKSNGLYGYIRNNNFKSAILLLSYVLIALLVCIAVCIMIAITTTPGTIATKYDSALRLFSAEWLHMMAISFLWAGLASLQFQSQINRATDAHEITRIDNPKLYNFVENLSVACGISTPRISVIETGSMNAFTTGLSSNRVNLTVTRGLLSHLSGAQLNAVLAHEFTKIVSKDTRHLSLATVFTSICLYMTAFIFRPFYKPGFRMLVLLLALPLYPFQMGVVMAITALTAGLGALLVKLLISKTRVFVADAGACELMKDPESLVSALKLIAYNDMIVGTDITTRPLLFSDTRIGWFNSHPTIDERVTTIKTYITLVPSASPTNSFDYPKAKPVKRHWRETFNLPFWVASSSTMIPILIMAAFFSYNSSWSAIDRAEVQKYQDSIQKALELAMRFSDSSTRPMVKLIALSQEWTYGIKIDHAKLETITGLDAQNAAFQTLRGEILSGKTVTTSSFKDIEPTPEEMVALKSLDQGSWNKGTKPPHAFLVSSLLVIFTLEYCEGSHIRSAIDIEQITLDHDCDATKLPLH
jgi:heat shock protein HtpX